MNEYLEKYKPNNNSTNSNIYFAFQISKMNKLDDAQLDI